MNEMNPIKEYIVEKDIIIMTEKATDFGKDIGDSYVRLAEKLNTPGQTRDCYGIVTKDSDGMSYFSGMTMLSMNEAEEKSISTYTILSGKYHSILIEEWNKKMLEIGPTFDQILKSGLVETMSPCIEFYRTNSELICMVKSK